MRNTKQDYPWYCAVSGKEITQGDILENCPVFTPPTNLSIDNPEAKFKLTKRDVIIMSQSCDIEHNKIDEVLLCFVWKLSQHTQGHLSNLKGKEEVRRGQLPALHMLDKCELPGVNREISVVDFHYIYTLPLDFCKEFAGRSGRRIRLLSPYREHLSQAFARFFMRVGLPVDIPPFE